MRVGVERSLMDWTRDARAVLLPVQRGLTGAVRGCVRHLGIAAFAAGPTQRGFYVGLYQSEVRERAVAQMQAGSRVSRSHARLYSSRNACWVEENERDALSVASLSVESARQQGDVRMERERGNGKRRTSSKGQGILAAKAACQSGRCESARGTGWEE